MASFNRVAGNGYYGVGLAAAAIAAGAMFLLDPRSGARRRALLRDQATRGAHLAEEFVSKAGRDARQRARGLYNTQAARFREAEVDDRVLAERVRASLGRLTSHPGPIYVTCRHGVVRLRGDVLQHEAAQVLRGVAHVRGVRSVVDELRVHAEAGKISSLQGAGVPRSSARFEYLQSNWSPAPRLLAGAVGAALALGGLGRRTSLGYGLAACGVALLTRSICNRPLSHVLGVGAAEADGVHVQKTIEVYAEVDEVYACWRDPECFPRFMSHVRDVERIGETRYRWTVDGPAGMPVVFDAEITADAPGELIAWRTVDANVVESSGAVHFEPTTYGGTRIHVQMIYRPLANRLGHTVARIFGRDPKHQIDADLLRFKTYMEMAGLSLGAPPSSARAPSAAAVNTHTQSGAYEQSPQSHEQRDPIQH